MRKESSMDNMIVFIDTETISEEELLEAANEQ